MEIIKDSLLKDGIILIDELFDQKQLIKIVQESEDAIKSNLSLWQDGVDKGIFSTVFFDVESCFLTPETNGMLEQKMFALMVSLKLGKPILKDIRLRFTTPYPMPYVQWHRDHQLTDCRDLRITIYLNDVYPESGEFRYVKGSHLKENSHMKYADTELMAMKGYTAFSAQQGATMIFDPYGVHSVSPNNGTQGRLAIMLYYHMRNEF